MPSEAERPNDAGAGMYFGPWTEATATYFPTADYKPHKLKLPTVAQTAEEATYAVARLGGHLRRNGAPGWQTLGRGFEALLLMQAGWRAAIALRKGSVHPDR